MCLTLRKIHHPPNPCFRTFVQYLPRGPIYRHFFQVLISIFIRIATLKQFNFFTFAYQFFSVHLIPLKPYILHITCIATDYTLDPPPAGRASPPRQSRA